MLATTPVVLGAFAEIHPPLAPQVLAAAAPVALARPTSGAAALLSSPVFWVWIRLPVLRPSGNVDGGLGDDAGPSTNFIGCSGGTRQQFAALTLSGFWLGFTGSRLIASVLGATGVLTEFLAGPTSRRCS